MKTTRPDDTPEDVYVGFVRSLFHDGNILLIGAFTQGLVASLVYWKTHHSIYLYEAAFMVGACLLRYFWIQRVDKDAIVDYRTAIEHEHAYLVGGTLHAALAGFFAFTCLFIVPDAFGEVAAISMVLANTVTIAGRNFGSRKMVAILSLASLLPISAGLMLKGDVYHVLLGLFIIPFIITINKMARLVRTVLYTAIREEKKVSRLARHFDRALNTMSHGLLMFDRSGSVIVANAGAVALLGSKSADHLLGRSMKALLLRGRASGLLNAKDRGYLEGQLVRALRDGRDRKVLVALGDGRHIEFSAREGTDDIAVVTFEDVTSRIEAEERVQYMARYDSLTGLPNRAYFYEMVADAIAAGDRERFCGLAVIDLDDFKSVNDTLGHPIGDGLLAAVAEQLAACAPDVKISRFGGDEFMLYFDRVDGVEDLNRRLAAIFDGLQGEVDVAGHNLRIQASAGATMSRVRDCEVDSMIVEADLALYKAKEFGKHSWRLFESSMDAAFRNRQRLKNDLREAIENKRLRAVYQPIIALDTMQIANCEALCRWDHPELGPISPAVFIPLAEEMGIVSEISLFMLSSACNQCVTWPERLSVSVNLSANDFRTVDIVEKVRRTLRETGLAPQRLEIEVTETALLDDRAQTRACIEELRALGTRVALDDFGTGYSSLSYLHTLPLDKVKMDRSFLADVTQNERSLDLLKGVVNLSKSLGLAITVEGVETFEQLKILSDIVKPDLVQGFLFGAPLSAVGVETMSHIVWSAVGERPTAAKLAV